MNKQSKPGWEIRLETQIKKLRKQAWMTRKRYKRKEGTGNLGIITVQLEEINQKVLAKEGRLKRYRLRVNHHHHHHVVPPARISLTISRHFSLSFIASGRSSGLHRVSSHCCCMGGSDTKTYQQLHIKETERLWTKIWQPKKHNENAEWINKITRELDGLEKGPKMEIHIVLLQTTLQRMSNGKVPGHDGIHGFWFKKFTSIHGRLALEMNRCLQGAQVPEWMTKGKTTLIQKDPSKGTAPNNYRPITCLPMMWKILTAQISEKVYYSLTSRGLFPDNQKGCHKGSRSIAELLYIDQHILNESKTRRKNSSYSLDWLQKGIWYGPTNLDTTLSQNV